MKKIILLAAAALFTTGAFAQGIEWGVKAGVNIAKQTKVTNAKARTGIYAGVFGEYVASDYFGVQAELLYYQTGVKSHLKADNVDLKSTAINNYLVLPILAKFYVLEGLSIDVGPQFGYLVSAKAKQGSKSPVGVYESMKKKFDMAAVLGLSYKVAGHFDVSARYNLGLAKISKTDKVKNNVVSLGVGYRF